MSVHSPSRSYMLGIKFVLFSNARCRQTCLFITIDFRAADHDGLPGVCPSSFSWYLGTNKQILKQRLRLLAFSTALRSHVLFGLTSFRSFITMYRLSVIQPHRNHTIWLLCALIMAFHAVAMLLPLPTRLFINTSPLG